MLVDFPITLFLYGAMKTLQCLFEYLNQANTASGWAIGMSLGPWLSVCSTNGRWGSVNETCLKTKTSTLNSTIRRPFTPLVFSLHYLVIWLLFITHFFHFFLWFFFVSSLPSIFNSSFILSALCSFFYSLPCSFYFERCMAINSQVTGGLFIPFWLVRRSIGLSVKRVA